VSNLDKVQSKTTGAAATEAPGSPSRLLRRRRTITERN